MHAKQGRLTRPTHLVIKGIDVLYLSAIVAADHVREEFEMDTEQKVTPGMDSALKTRTPKQRLAGEDDDGYDVKLRQLVLIDKGANDDDRVVWPDVILSIN